MRYSVAGAFPKSLLAIIANSRQVRESQGEAELHLLSRILFTCVGGSNPMHFVCVFPSLAFGELPKAEAFQLRLPSVHLRSIGERQSAIFCRDVHPSVRVEAMAYL